MRFGHTFPRRCYVAAGHPPDGCYTTVGGQAELIHNVGEVSRYPK